MEREMESSDNFTLMEEACKRQNLASFIAAANAVDWERRSADDFVQTVERALSLGGFDLARRLALKGFQKHGGNQSSRLGQLARILAPARVRRTNLPPDPAIELNRNWLKAHASEYRNRWIAIRMGKLLADGATIQELVFKVPDRKGALLMRIP
jgi:hypothetical protein